MLDDLNYLKNRDSHQHLKALEDSLDVLADVPDNLQFSPQSKISQVIVLTDNPFASAAARLWRASCSDVSIIIPNRRDLNLPINKQTLLIAVLDIKSDSDIESIQLGAEKNSAEVVVLTQEDKTGISPLIRKKVNCLNLKTSFQSQESLLIFYRALLFIEAAIKERDFAGIFQPVLKNLASSIQKWGSTSPTNKNLAKQLAYETIGKTPVIYTQPSLFSAAFKWKFDINRIAQQLAWAGSWSVGNQVEVKAWSNQIFDKNYIIFYLSDCHNGKNKGDFERASRSLSGKMPQPWFIEAQGGDRLEKILWLSLLANFFSLYLAFLNNAKLAKY